MARIRMVRWRGFGSGSNRYGPVRRRDIVGKRGHTPIGAFLGLMPAVLSESPVPFCTLKGKKEEITHVIWTLPVWIFSRDRGAVLRSPPDACSNPLDCRWGHRSVRTRHLVWRQSDSTKRPGQINPSQHAFGSVPNSEA